MQFPLVTDIYCEIRFADKLALALFSLRKFNTWRNLSIGIFIYLSGSYQLVQASLEVHNLCALLEFAQQLLND